MPVYKLYNGFGKPSKWVPDVATLAITGRKKSLVQLITSVLLLYTLEFIFHLPCKFSGRFCPAEKGSLVRSHKNKLCDILFKF